MSSLDVSGRRRSPATTSEFHLGRTPANKGMRYPADPPRVEEIVAVMRHAGEGAHGDRVRGLIVVMWRAGAPQRGGRHGSPPVAVPKGEGALDRNPKTAGRRSAQVILPLVHTRPQLGTLVPTSSRSKWARFRREAQMAPRQHRGGSHLSREREWTDRPLRQSAWHTELECPTGTPTIHSG